MKRYIVTALACAVVVGSVGTAGASGPVSAPGAKKVNKNATITIDVGNISALQIDPHKEANASELPFGYMLYDRLFYLDKNVELQPMLATKWSFSSDGMSLTATVRDDAVFHDGSPVTPDAVKQSITRAQTLTGSTARAALSVITAVEVVGTDQVKFTMSRPAAELPYALARNAGAIINPKAIAANMDLSKGDNNVAGSGPWVATEWVPQVRGTFTRASTPYWDKKAAKIKTINIIMTADPNTALNSVKSGQSEATLVHTSIVDAARAVSGHKLYEYPTQGSYNLMFKESRGGLIANVKFRQALAQALDRKTISEQLLNNTCKAAEQPFPPGTAGSHSNFKNPFPYNMTKAKADLAASGAGANPTITMLLGASLEPQTSIGTALVAAFKDLGVTVNVTTAPAGVITTDFTAGKYDAYIQINGGQGFPTLWMQRYILPDATIYRLATGPEGEAFSTLVKSANDPNLKGATYTQKWDQINEQFAKNAWSIPICYDTRYWLFPKDVKNAKSMSWVWAVGWDPRYLTRTAKS